MKFESQYPFVKYQTPTPNGRDIVREIFPLPRFNERKFQHLAEQNDIDLEEINVQRLLENFQLRLRHLQDEDLSDDEKKRIAKKVPAVNESSEYQRAMFLLTVGMCRLDRDKASAILYCFARLSESNIRRRVNKLCITIGDF